MTLEEFEKWRDECDENGIEACDLCPVRRECSIISAVEEDKSIEDATGCDDIFSIVEKVDGKVGEPIGYKKS